MKQTNLTINERIADLRINMKLTQTELSEKTGIPKSTISRIENGKITAINNEIISKLAVFFDVSADYLLGLTDVKMKKNVELNALGLSNKALCQILSGKLNVEILSLLIENNKLPRFLDYAQTYFDDTNVPGVMARNAVLDYGVNALKDYAKETPEKGVEIMHDINAINSQKLGTNESELLKLRDLMMNILKDIKAASGEKREDADISEVKSMIAAMAAQAEETKQTRPVTADDMSEIVMKSIENYNFDKSIMNDVRKLVYKVFRFFEK